VLATLYAVPQDLTTRVAVTVYFAAPFYLEQVDPAPRHEIEAQRPKPHPFTLRHPRQLVAVDGSVRQGHVLGEGLERFVDHSLSPA
jgi:hypothetical protein